MALNIIKKIDAETVHLLRLKAWEGEVVQIAIPTKTFVH